MKKAAICETAFQDRECSIDQGGLMLVAAVILWLAAFVISVIFFKPELEESNGILENYAVPIRKSSSSGSKNTNTNGNGNNANVNAQSAPQFGQQRNQKSSGSKFSRATASSSPTVPAGNGSLTIRTIETRLDQSYSRQRKTSTSTATIETTTKTTTTTHSRRRDESRTNGGLHGTTSRSD
jgi:hypothetical protein